MNRERTTNTVELPTEAPQKVSHRDRREHIFSQREGKAAAELNVEFRAFCGVWISPPDKEGGLLISMHGFGRNQCGNCVRIYKARVAAGVCK